MTTKILEVVRDAEGGMKRHVESLIERLDRKKYTVIIACSKVHRATFEAMGVKVYDIDLGERRGPHTLYMALNELRRILLEEKVEVIHAHGAMCCIAASIAVSRLSGIRLITTIHNFPSEVKGIKGHLYPLLLSHALKSSHHIVFVSEALKAHYQVRSKIREEKTSVIYNGIDFDAIGELSESLEHYLPSTTKETPLILCVARLIPEKGVDEFIEAASKVMAQGIFPQFLVAGEGPEGKKLKQKAINLHIEKNIEFLGHRNDIYPLMKASNLVVLPSYREGLGLTLLEAMALKKPVIATNVGGIPEVVIDGKTGILIPPGNAIELSNAIIKIVQDEDLAKSMGEAGYYLVKEKFSLGSMMDKLHLLLKDSAP